MSEPAKPARAESPTTAKALDFDDDNVESSPAGTAARTTESTPAPAPGSGEDAAPLKPPRPLGPEQQAETTLKEAFPTVELPVIRAILRASGGRVEPAFNALLGMTDPAAAEAAAAPPQPPRPQAQQQWQQQPVPYQTSTEDSQLAADERYARQLAEHYNGVDSYQRQGRGQRPQQSRGPLRSATASYSDEDRERSFIDDDLPVIRENIKKGFLETQTTVNKWVNNLRKKLDGEEDDEDVSQGRSSASAQRGYPYQQPYGSQRSGEFAAARRSTDRDRYDADPQVLDDDFAGLQMRDQEDAPRKSGRPLANPDLFKPTPRPPSSASGRRVSFQDGPPEEIDVHYPTSASPKRNAGNASAGKTSKWQPLDTVEPSPVTDSDPFSLGDNSDDDEAKKKEVRVEDGERLKQAAAEAMADDIGSKDDSKKKPETQEKSGSADQRDKVAEDLATKT